MTLTPAHKKRLPLIVAAVAALALVIGGVVWWQGKQRWEATDNAFVQADTTGVSPQIDGYVVEVLVADNQRVAPGQILIRLDDADARANLAEAEGNLASVIAAVGNVDARAAQEQAVIASRAAGVAQARAQADLAAQQVDRYGRLAEQGWVSQARIQTEQAGARTAQASVAEAEAALIAEQRTAGVLGSSRSQSLAAVDVARAAVVIDVDGGDRKTLGDAERFAQELNLAAAEMAARQISLRSLGGLVLVDFIGMKQAEGRRALVAKFRDALGLYLGRSSDVLEMSRLGVVEAAIARRGRPLSGALAAGSVERIALENLRAIETAGWQDRGARLAARVSPEVEAWLDHDHIGWQKALGDRIGQRWTIEPIPGHGGHPDVRSV
jgi:multidrug efflux pump subunit AcrA (membrane-fusion protein)